MRQTIGGSWLIGLMVLFILLFAGYIILTIDYNKSVRVKNEAISLIEKYEGLNEESITLVNNYLMGAGYMTTGRCGEQDGMYGAISLESNELEEAVNGQRYYYCVKKYKGANTSYYYQISLFYRFNLPVLGDTSRFTIKGSTANFQAKDDPKYAKTVDGSMGGTIDNNVNNGGNNQIVYTIRFNVNGGSTSIPVQRVEAGGRAYKPTDPVRNGYTFKGWKFAGNTWDFSNTVTGNMVLIADWQKNTSSNNSNSNNNNTKKKYTIVFDFNGGKWGAGNGFSGWSSLTDYEEEGYNKLFDGLWVSTVKSGYTLDYFVDQDGNKYYRSNASFKVSKDMQLRAVWK